MVLVGSVEGKVAILVDDMADTCGTLALAAQRLAESGAERVLAIVTHGVLSHPALERIMESRLEKLIVTNTIPQTSNARKCPKIEIIDVSHVLAETIRRSHYGESVSVLFNQIPYDTTQPYRHGTDTPGLEDGPASASASSPRRQLHANHLASSLAQVMAPTGNSSDAFPPSSYNDPDPPPAQHYFAADRAAPSSQGAAEEQTPRMRHADAVAAGRFADRRGSAASTGVAAGASDVAAMSLQSPPPTPGGGLPPPRA